MDCRLPKPRAARAARRIAEGFTLIELLVVLVILGLLVGLVGPQVMRYLGGAKTDTAKLQIENLAAALDLLLLDVGRYPTEDEGLETLVQSSPSVTRWNGPYLSRKELPLDPWNNPYHYRVPGKNGPFDIYSLGADNAEGGEGENQDVNN